MGARGPYAIFEMLLHAVQGMKGVDPHLGQLVNFNRLAALPDDAERIRYCRSTFKRVAAAIGGKEHGSEDPMACIVEFMDGNFLDYLNRKRVDKAKELLSLPVSLIKGVGAIGSGQ